MHHKATRSIGEAGSLTMMFAVVAMALIAIVGLVFDGRALLSAQQRADNAAAEAARAAGQEIDGGVVAGRHGVDRTRAVAAARAHLRDMDVTGSVSIRGSMIIVRTQVTEPAAILPLVGIRTLTADGFGVVEIMTGL